MNDIQKARALIIDIEQFLSVGIMPAGITAELLAGKYCDLCDRAFTRINRCIAAIDSGRYTEAIREAEASPSLLDFVAVLNFGRWGDWLKFVEEEGCPVARTLSDELLLRINEAYSLAKGVAPIERSLRRAMLHRPVDLYGGILALRRLSKAQGRSEEAKVLRQDLRAFELRRLKQIESEYEVAENSSDLNGATSLLAELSEEWQEREPKQRVLDCVKEGIDKLRRQFAAKRVKEVVDELWDAYSAGRLIMAEVYLSQYRKLQDEGYFKPDEETLRKVKEVSEWYEEEAEVRNKSAEVKESIEMLREYVNTPRVSDLKDLRRLRNFVFGVNFDELHNVLMPNDLPPEKVNSVIETLAGRARVRTSFITISALAMTVFVLVAGFFVYRGWEVSRQAEYYKDTLTSAEKALDWESFKELKDELDDVAFSGRIKMYPDVQSALAKSDSLEKAVKSAVEGFDDRVALLKRIAADGYNDNDNDKFLEEFRVLKKLHLGYPVLRNDSRAEQISQIKDNRQSYLNTRLMGEESRLQELADSVKELTAQYGSNIYDLVKSVDSLTNRIAFIDVEAEEVDRNIDKCLARGATSSSVNGTRGLFKLREKEGRVLVGRLLRCKTLCGAINCANTFDSYHDAMSAYMDEFPGCAQSALFRELLDRWSLYDDFLCWKGIDVGQTDEGDLIEKTSVIKKDNQFWNPVFANYIAPKKRFQTVAAEIREDIPAWKADEYLTQMYYYYLEKEKKTFIFKTKPKKIETGVGNNVKYEIAIYEPKKGDTKCVFNKIEKDILPKNITMMNHCQFMNKLIDRIANKETFNKPENVVSVFQEIRTTDEVSIEIFRLNLMRYFAEKAIEVYGSETLPDLDAFCRNSEEIDTECDWMCFYSSQVIKKNSECEKCVEEQLKNVDPEFDIRLMSLIYEKCLTRGVCWLGYVSPVSGEVVMSDEHTGREVWVLRDDASGTPYPVVASADGKRFDVDLNKGECLFGASALPGMSTAEINKEIEKKIGRKLTDDDLPLVWPRLSIESKIEVTQL